MATSLFYNFVVWFTALAAMFAGGFSSPSTDDVITVDETANLTAVVWGDTQVSNYLLSRNINTKVSAEDLYNINGTLDAFIHVGDVTENGLLCEYNLIADYLYGVDAENFIITEGNHDIRMRLYSQSLSRFSSFVNYLNDGLENDIEIEDKYYYSTVINGYTFIVLGSDKSTFEDNYISDEQLEWLANELEVASESGLPIFVINHQPLAGTNGLPDTFSSIISDGSIGDQSDDVFELMNQYENVIYISGHCHTAFGDLLYETKGNVNLVNIPSIGIDNKDGDYNEAGIGFVLTVTDDQVIFAARDFYNGIYLPEYDIVIDLV